MADQNQPKLPTVESAPYSVEDTGTDSGNKIDQLLATAVTVRQELHDRTRKIALGMAGIAIFFTLALGAALGVLVGLRDQADTLTDIANANKANGEIARENSEAIKAATGPEARARSAAATTDVIRRNVIEGDCRMRRVQARISAPDPATSCESQTPANIYPGIDGQPLR